MTLKTAIKKAMQTGYMGRDVTVMKDGFLLSARKRIDNQEVDVYYRYYTDVQIRVYSDRYAATGFNDDKPFSVSIPTVYLLYDDIKAIHINEKGNASENAESVGIDTVSATIVYADNVHANIDLSIRLHGQTVQTMQFYSDHSLPLHHITPMNGYSVDINKKEA